MSDFQVFYLPCHTDNAVGAATPDCRCLPEKAQLFVEMQPALDALFADPVMMGDHSLLILTMLGEVADRLAVENKLLAHSNGTWSVAPGAEEEFMKAQFSVRMLPRPAQQTPPGERATLYLGLSREQTSKQEGAWAFGLRLCGGDKTACTDKNFTLRVYGERDDTIAALRKPNQMGADDDVALVELEVIADMAKHALCIAKRFRQGYVPAANHMQHLLDQSICALDLQTPSLLGVAQLEVSK